MRTVISVIDLQRDLERERLRCTRLEDGAPQARPAMNTQPNGCQVAREISATVARGWRRS